MATALPRTLTTTEAFIKNGKKLLLIPYHNHQQVRFLNVHEHISYMLLRDQGIPVPKFHVATTPDEASKGAKELNTKDMVIKAQVLAGGRGRGSFKNGFKGGVRMVNSPEQAREYAGKMIGQLLVTKQTGPAGRICNKVMITERKFPRREFYLAIMMERSFNGPVIIASSQGGVSIEDVAKESPEAITYEPINIKSGIQDEQICRVLEKIGLKESSGEVGPVIKQMYKLFCEKDALLVEINPFAEDVITNKFFCLDAKFRFDDNAAFRQKKLHSFRDITQENPKELHAKKFQLNFISLDGTIGCMVNGAGLAMAVMDIIKLKGGDPANFLDVGGGNTAKAVAEAFRMIISDERVSAIFVNIFGGIMTCDTIAEGIITAAKNLNIKVPIIVRLLGAKSKEAQAMIASAGLQIVSQQDMDKAAELVVKLSNIVSMAKQIGVEEVHFKFGPTQGSGGGGSSKKTSLSSVCRKYSSSSGSDKGSEKKDPCLRFKQQKKPKKKGPPCAAYFPGYKGNRVESCTAYLPEGVQNTCPDSKSESLCNRYLGIPTPKSSENDCKAYLNGDDDGCSGSLNAKIGMGKKKGSPKK